VLMVLMTVTTQRHVRTAHYEGKQRQCQDGHVQVDPESCAVMAVPTGRFAALDSLPIGGQHIAAMPRIIIIAAAAGTNGDGRENGRSLSKRHGRAVCDVCCYTSIVPLYQYSWWTTGWRLGV
jgi:hypothetical protein